MSGEWNETSNQEKLREIVLQHSQAKEWEDAKREWTLLTIFDEKNHCICDHSIVENCVIFNSITGKVLIVGNVCINHFNEKALTVPPICRSSLKNLKEDPSHRNANAELLTLAARLHILSLAEARWYFQNTNGRNSRAQFDRHHKKFKLVAFEKREKLNHLILHGFSSKRPKCNCPGRPYAKPRQNGKTKKYFYSCPNFDTKNSQAGCRFNQSIDS